MLAAFSEWRTDMKALCEKLRRNFSTSQQPAQKSSCSQRQGRMEEWPTFNSISSIYWWPEQRRKLREQRPKNWADNSKQKARGKLNTIWGSMSDKNGSALLKEIFSTTKPNQPNGPLGTKPIATPLKMGFAPREEVEIEKNKLCWKPMPSLLYIAKVSWPDIAVAAGLLYESLESHLLCERRFDSWQEIAEAVIG